MGLDQPTATLIAGVFAAAGSTAVGVAAIFFGTRQARRGLELQRDERLWKQRDEVYQELERWLAGNRWPHEPHREPERWETSREMEARIRLYASDEVISAFERLTELADHVVVMAGQFERAREEGDEPGSAGFALTNPALSHGWKTWGDAKRSLDALLEELDEERTRLEAALRKIYRPRGD